MNADFQDFKYKELNIEVELLLKFGPKLEVRPNAFRGLLQVVYMK
jgi:hypothetical protein